jgi:branched-chain amino acid transport system substrate-binding protein
MVEMLQKTFASAMLAALLVTVAPASAVDTSPFEIDAIASLTGSGAFIGQGEQDTLRRVEDSVNRTGGIHGRPIHFVVYDDQTNPQLSVQLMSQILAKKAAVVIGPTITPTCLAVMPFVQDKIVQYCGSPGIHPPRGSYSFSSTIGTPDLFRAFVQFFRERGLTHLAMLVPSDAVGQDADANMKYALSLPENKNVDVVAHEYMNNTDLSVAAQIAKIKNAKPQALIAWTVGTPTGTVLRAMTDAGFDVPVATSNANMTYAAMKQWAGFLPKEFDFPGVPYLAGLAGSAQQQIALRSFFEEMKLEGARPDFQTGLFWDPAMLIVTAFRTLGTNATPQQIRDHIEKVHDFAGISGVYDFRDGSQRGLSQKDVIIMRWDVTKGTWVAASSFGGAQPRR